MLCLLIFVIALEVGAIPFFQNRDSQRLSNMFRVTQPVVEQKFQLGLFVYKDFPLFTVQSWGFYCS